MTVFRRPRTVSCGGGEIVIVKKIFGIFRQTLDKRLQR